MNKMPILYSFRRCPYAIRARMALVYSNIHVEIREIVLRDKPQHMLELSPKGTVPVLQCLGGQVVEESLNIMLWACQQNDPEQWLGDAQHRETMLRLINENDFEFKPNLDRYKYPERYDMGSNDDAKVKVLAFLRQLDQRLKEHSFLLSNRECLADVAIFPFVRQCVRVDEAWFLEQSLEALQAWYQYFMSSDLYLTAMRKYPVWQPDAKAVRFP